MQVVLLGRVIILRAKPHQSFISNEGSRFAIVRPDGSDKHVDSQIKFFVVDKEGVAQVLLYDVPLLVRIRRNVLVLVYEKDAASLGSVLRLHDERLLAV